MKPRWPRFSLRTLIIAVLGIALCWTLTATWGVSTIFNFYSKIVPFAERNGSVLRVVEMNNNEDVSPEKVWEVRATAIAPFLIRLSITRGGEVRAEPITHLWFFGYQYRWTAVPEGFTKK